MVRWLYSLIFESSGKLIFLFFQVKRAKEKANAGAKAQERIRRWCYQANDTTAYLWLVEHDLPPTHPRHTYSKNVFRSFLQPRPQCLHIWVFAERELQGLKLHWSRKFGWCTIYQVTGDVTSYRVLHIYITGDVTLWFKGSQLVRSVLKTINSPGETVSKTHVISRPSFIRQYLNLSEKPEWFQVL